MDSVVLAAASAIWFAILVPVVARRVACPMAPLDGRGATLAFALVLVFSQVSLVFDVPRDDGTAVLDQGLSASNLLQVALTGASALYVALRVLIEPRLGRLPFAPPYLAMTLMIAYDGASALWSVVPSYTVYRTIEVATFSLATLVVFDRSSIERRLGPLLALSVAGWLVAAGPDLVLNLPRGIVFSAAKNNMMPLVCAALMLVALFEPATPRRPLLFAFGAVGFVLAGSAASTGALLAAFAPAMLIASPRRPLRLAGAALAALALVVMLGLILGLANVPSLLDLASTVLQKPPSELANATGARRVLAAVRRRHARPHVRLRLRGGRPVHPAPHPDRRSRREHRPGERQLRQRSQHVSQHLGRHGRRRAGLLPVRARQRLQGGPPARARGAPHRHDARPHARVERADDAGHLPGLDDQQFRRARRARLRAGLRPATQAREDRAPRAASRVAAGAGGMTERTRVRRRAAVLLLLALSAGSARAEPAVTIRVDPVHGRDGASAEGPVASLQGALDRVATLRRRRADLPIAIEFSPGVHRLARAATITAAHGGTGAAPLVIRGAADGTTEIRGSVPLAPTSEAVPAALAARLPTAARGHVVVYRLPSAARAAPHVEGLSLLRNRPAARGIAVYDEGGALAPAHWPKTGWAHVQASAPGPDGAGATLEDARLARWRGETDAWAEGFWTADWLFEAVPLGAIDPGRRRVGLPDLPDRDLRAGARFRITHALSELDTPGEWWRDGARGLLLAWPQAPATPLDVAVATTLLAVDGAAHVRLEHLRLGRALGDLVTVRGSRDVIFTDVAFAGAGGRGLVFETSTDSGLEGCRLDDIGGTGVVLHGGDRAALTGGGLFVRDSRIARYARLILTQQAAIDVDGVGATIAGNRIEDAGAPAIALHGNDHEIAGNEVSDLLAGVSDSGAIYAGRDWTARGTTIEGNFLHDIRADPGSEVKGIYLDDFASGFTIRRNLFVRVDQPVFIGGGRDNAVLDNLFVASSPAVHIDSRGETWAASSFSDPESELLAAYRAMPTGSPAWRRRYPALIDVLANEPAVAKANRIVGNTFLASRALDFTNAGAAARQQIAGNVGPDGLTSATGADLAARAATSRDPRGFGDLLAPDGRPVGLDLGAGFRPPGPKPSLEETRP